MGKLFGTDGIRGAANEFPLDPRSLYTLGKALAKNYSDKLGRPARFLSGRDTRESGPAIEAALSQGVKDSGSVIKSAGVITTPGVAYLTGSEECDAGIVISASHNPFEDNGIKIFTPSGKKASRTIEEALEKAIENGSPSYPESVGDLDETDAARLRTSYINHLVDSFAGLDISDVSIVIDGANGAASGLAPELYERLGASVISFNDQPNGKNINLNCGSLHLDGLRQRVVDESADIGIAFDGDADRSLFVDSNGEIVDGDAVLWVISQSLLKKDELKSGKVVSTVMSNMGLELAFRAKGIELIRTSVGDKYVLEALLETKAEIGGEQSGHIIMPAMSLVGDGMLTGLLVLQAMAESGLSLSELSHGFQRLPQVLLNVRVARKPPFDEVEAINRVASQVETKLGSKGRLLLRYSGTENLARVMVEGEDKKEIDNLAAELVSVIKMELE